VLCCALYKSSFCAMFNPLEQAQGVLATQHIVAHVNELLKSILTHTVSMVLTRQARSTLHMEVAHLLSDVVRSSLRSHIAS
jgi:hypothetical protein